METEVSCLTGIVIEVGCLTEIAIEVVCLTGIEIEQEVHQLVADQRSN